MNELICHLFGDYIIQNHWMALNKTKSTFVAFVHALTYSLPFLVLTRNAWSLAIIFGTHLIIDRFSIAKRWPQFWGVGKAGWVLEKIHAFRREIYATNRNGIFADLELEFDRLQPLPESAPPFLAVWLTIIVDNTIHLLINHLALYL